MSDTLIERAEKSLEGVSPGPWRYTTCYGVAFIEASDGHGVASAVEYLTPNNADFISDARSFVPELIAALKAANALVAQVRQGHKDIAQEMLESCAEWSADYDVLEAERDKLRAENERLISALSPVNYQGKKTP